MKKKTKVAIIGSRGYPYVYSGYETLVKNLAERLIRNGIEVRVYCHRSLFNERPKNLNGIELVYTPSIETKVLSQFINSFFSFIHLCFSDVDKVLILNTANGPFGILTKIFNKKTCINVDGLEWLRPKWKGFGNFYFKIATKLATVFFDVIISDSTEIQKIYKKKYGKESNVIRYGPSLAKTFKSNYLKEKNIQKEQYYLIVGRLIPDNNVLFIVNSFLKSKSTKKLVVVGDVPYIDNYSTKVKSIRDERIVFLGYVKDQSILNELYQKSLFYIHGHEFGGTNPTMVNALFQGCQILALDTKFNREMLDKKKAFLFKKNNNSLIRYFNSFENLEFKKDNSEKYIFPKIYNWDFITEQYVKIFNSL